VIFLDVEDLLHIAERATGAPVEVRDIGLLEAAAARPRASAFGADAYPTLHHKAAALLHSIVKNHALVDGNKRLGLAAVIAFYGLTLLLFSAFPDRRRLDLAVLATFAGAAIEILQLIEGRDAELGDILADAAGAFAVLAPLYLDQMRRPRVERRRSIPAGSPRNQARGG